MSVVSISREPILPNPTTREPTLHLRYVAREGEKILQQMWSVKTFHPETLACIGLHGEWEDVPTEPEE